MALSLSLKLMESLGDVLCAHYILITLLGVFRFCSFFKARCRVNIIVLPSWGEKQQTYKSKIKAWEQSLLSFWHLFPEFVFTHWLSKVSPGLVLSPFPDVTSSPRHKQQLSWVKAFECLTMPHCLKQRQSRKETAVMSLPNWPQVLPAKIWVRFLSEIGSSCSQHSVLISSELQSCELDNV